MNQPLLPEDRSRLEQNLREVLQRLRTATERGGRTADHCRLLPVVKRMPDAVVEALLELGQVDLAESRVQALLARPESLRQAARFHMIGPLQTNKARPAVSNFHSFHALDSDRLGTVLERESARLEITWPVFLQVILGGEDQKRGCSLNGLPQLCRDIAHHDHLEVCGVMGMPPKVSDPEQCRPLFHRLRERTLELLAAGDLPEGARELSMGMSADFEVAAEEGATVVRVGSGLFRGMFESSQAVR